PLFIKCLDNLERFHKRISRIQVTHSKMRDLILSTGIDPNKIFMIPIGINVNFFPRQTPLSKSNMRKKYQIPGDAVVIGSFQKDGNGWEHGDIPKLVKGPDVFLKTVEILKKKIPELFILLSGPARGYVKNGLDKMNIPYCHIYLEDYPKISELYHCLDLYIVTAREEGGPKAVLESMSSGIPLVTTKVGQAVDLVKHGRNGWMAEVGDVEGLAYWVERALNNITDTEEVIRKGFDTAMSNTYKSQVPVWKKFFHGLVEPV
ncbi:glycosyltransferase family 4 protein, partial [Thermodesulfobacteriota bacterium]